MTSPMLPANPPESDVAERKEINGTTETSVSLSAIGPDGVDTETGDIEEWIQALREKRSARKAAETLLNDIGKIMEVATLWGKERPWVQSVSLYFPKSVHNVVDERGASLIVEAKPADWNSHEAAAYFGLVVGAYFNVLIEPRIIPEPQERSQTGWLIIYQKERECPPTKSTSKE